MHNTHNTNLRECRGKVLVRDMQDFLSISTTTSSPSYKNHWQNLNGTDKRIVDIRDESFQNAERIVSKGKDAYALFEKFEPVELVKCHGLFVEWKDEDDPVEFWVIDNPAV
jgi:hypothetical protein